MLIGYARFSTQDQNLDLQVDSSIGASLTRAIFPFREQTTIGYRIMSIESVWYEVIS